jgi:hypothetical protein
MSVKLKRKKGKFALLVFGVLFSSALLLGCEGDDGARGPAGSSSGTLSGIVTNSATSTPIPDATITTEPDIQGPITTDASGSYSATFPIGVYQITYTANNFKTVTEGASIPADSTVTKDVALDPDSPVVVMAGADVSGVPGQLGIPLTATIEILDGSTQTGILWEQAGSVDVTINNPDTASPTVDLPAEAVYKAELIKVLEEGAIVDLPPGVEQTGEFFGGLQDRFQVAGINPFSLEEAGLVTLKVTVTTDSGTYTDAVEIHTTLPWKASLGINDVPPGIPVLLHGGTSGGTQTAWNWTLGVPTGSSATFDSGATTSTDQNPSFIPDVAGTYTLTESDSGETFDVIAVNWVGVITNQDSNGRPLAENCTISVCHAAGGAAPDKFTPWMETGQGCCQRRNRRCP